MSRIDSMEPDKNGTKKISTSYPLEFHYVRALFLQTQYRQCITTCRQVLDGEDDEQHPHPLHETFMRFYLALAHDELARAMHNYSTSKLSAFALAEALYHEAAGAIPDGSDCNRLVQQHKQIIATQHIQPEAVSTLPQSTSQSTINSDVFRQPPSPSPFLSPPSQPLTRLPTISSPDNSSSDIEDDLESDDSFGDIVTPHRMQRLPSTYSSMSLLEPQKQAHSLLRPVRPGSIAKPYQAPLKFSPSSNEFRSRLPRLNTASSLGSPQQTPPQPSSPVRKQLRSSDETWSPVASPTSPVSPLGSAYVSSDDATISPVSPSTPIKGKGDVDFSNAPTIPSSDRITSNPLVHHLEGLRSQIETHVSLLQEAKQRTITAQAERSVKNNMRKVPASQARKLGSGVPQSRSFWLFTPEDMKVMDKQRRVENGRQRMWARPRFDPSRYQGLAERALGEL